MRTYLPNKVKYYKQFADVIHRKYKQMRYGIGSCKPEQDQDLIGMRKELVEWESNEDDGALSETKIQFKTWLGVKYDDVLYSKGGTGFIVSDEGKAPAMGLNYMGGAAQGGQNIIEINSGGCLTRINLNPAITINQNSSFVHTQTTPATMWDINHGMNLIPNVTTEDAQGNDIVGILDVVDNNRIKIYFNTPVAGKAYLS
jgi:hypothetical protein